LDSNKVPYKEVDVAQDKAGREEMVRKSGWMVVPVIDIDGEIVVGFDQDKLKEKLGL
jgi:glutaredoxin